MNGKRVWLYCRVASRENSVELLEAQKPILEDYAKEHGLEIVGCSSDVGSTLSCITSISNNFWIVPVGPLLLKTRTA